MPVADTNYESLYALTDVFDSSTVLPESGAIFQDGMYQRDLYNFLSNYITNFNAVNAKLDSDTGVNGTSYASTCNLDAIGAAGYKLEPSGMSDKLLLDALYDIYLMLRYQLAILDADTGVTDTTYTSGLLPTFPGVALKTTNPVGIYSQGSVIDYLNTVVTNFNALLAQLDDDA